MGLGARGMGSCTESRARVRPPWPKGRPGCSPRVTCGRACFPWWQRPASCNLDDSASPVRRTRGRGSVPAGARRRQGRAWRAAPASGRPQTWPASARARSAPAPTRPASPSAACRPQQQSSFRVPALSLQCDLQCEEKDAAFCSGLLKGFQLANCDTRCGPTCAAARSTYGALACLQQGARPRPAWDA